MKLFTTLFGIVIFVSDEHPEKAEEPIEVTLFGIVIFASDEHFSKASSPIEVKPYGILNSFMFLVP